MFWPPRPRPSASAGVAGAGHPNCENHNPIWTHTQQQEGLGPRLSEGARYARPTKLVLTCLYAIYLEKTERLLLPGAGVTLSVRWTIILRARLARREAEATGNLRESGRTEDQGAWLSLLHGTALHAIKTTKEEWQRGLEKGFLFFFIGKSVTFYMLIRWFDGFILLPTLLHMLAVYDFISFRKVDPVGETKNSTKTFRISEWIPLVRQYMHGSLACLLIMLEPLPKYAAVACQHTSYTAIPKFLAIQQTSDVDFFFKSNSLTYRPCTYCHRFSERQWAAPNLSC